MDFFLDKPVEPPRPKVGDLITVIINDQERHVIVTDAHKHLDGSYTVDVRLDPTEPPIT
jgi:hypothetical protein